MKTICFFNSVPSWGGGEKWHLEMASYVADLNYNVLFITTKNGVLDQKVQHKKINKAYVALTNFSYLNKSKVNKVSKILKTHQVDIVIFNSSKDIKFGGLAAKKADIKYIVYRRGSAIPIKNTFINRYFFSNVLTNIIANSHATKRTINENNNNLFPKEKIIVIPNGIYTTDFLSINYQNESSSDNSIILGNLGRLVKQKNQTFLLDVAKELKNRNINFKLIIGGEGTLKEKLIQKRNLLQLENEVEFEGFVKNPHKFMSKIDVFLLSSLWEGFGYVIAEAMLIKKPVIAFDISSNPELVIDGENGFLVEKEDLKKFVDKIEYLSKNKHLIAEMGKNGKEKIISQFDAKVARANFLNYIETLS